MRKPMAVLVGAILMWIVAIATLFNQPIAWWRTIVIAAVATFITGLYIRKRGRASSG
jgi:hypothetical protein